MLAIENLEVTYHSSAQIVHAVQGATLEVYEGEAVGLVGESGCGKSSLARGLIGLLPPGHATIAGGRIVIGEEDVTHLSAFEWPRKRGNPVAMIFQDSIGCLNPVMRVETQIAESVRRHDGAADINDRVSELLEIVKLPRAVRRAYPHELSGGMRQRVCIAIALGCRPRLLVADEPTTSLDTTTQAEILALLSELQRLEGMSLLLISHDLGVVRALCERVYIMYAGRIVEWGDTSEVFSTPAHPYTYGLLQAARSVKRDDGRYYTIDGDVPDLRKAVAGCAFGSRCPRAMDVCRREMPGVFEFSNVSRQYVRCWLHGPPRDSDPRVEVFPMIPEGRPPCGHLNQR